jgi:hypothetical protein
MSTWSCSTPPNTQLEQLDDHTSVDVLVIGAGGAGMSSVLVAALQVRTRAVGGKHGVRGRAPPPCQPAPVGFQAPPKGLAVEPGEYALERAKAFLNHAVGDKADAALRNAFVDHGAKAVATLEAHTEVQNQVRTLHPDYLSELEGSVLRGRAIEPIPFERPPTGRSLAS